MKYRTTVRRNWIIKGTMFLTFFLHFLRACGNVTSEKILRNGRAYAIGFQKEARSLWSFGTNLQQNKKGLLVIQTYSVGEIACDYFLANDTFPSVVHARAKGEYVKRFWDDASQIVIVLKVAARWRAKRFETENVEKNRRNTPRESSISISLFTHPPKLPHPLLDRSTCSRPQSGTRLMLMPC